MAQFSNYTAIDAPADADIFLVYDDSAGATRKVTLQQLGDYIDTDQGFVTGPGSSTDNAVARFDATTGKIVQDSGVIIDDSDNVTGVNTLAVVDAATTRSNLGLAINTDVQAYDADLAAIAALNPSANNLIYKNGSDAWDVTTITTFGASLIDDANASTARSTLGLVINTDVQAYSANLAAIAALAVTDGNIVVGNGSTWVAESGATARTSLGLGTGDSPTFAGLTSTGAISVPEAANIYLDGGSDTYIYSPSADRADIVAGGLQIANFTNSAGTRIFAAQGNITAVGTVTVASDLTLASGSITSASGAISFGNENLSTTGTFASGNATFAGKVSTSASTTARASLNIPSGTAPTSPTNGDIWSDGSDILVRLGGTTYTLTKA